MSAAPQDALGLVLTGGGARAAYQAGVLQALAERHPGLRAPVLTGVSAGAINAAFLAAREGDFKSGADRLAETWRTLELEDVFDVEGVKLLREVVRWLLRLGTGGRAVGRHARGFVDTAPLRRLLARELDADPASGEITRIQRNLEVGRLDAVAVTTIAWATGRTVTWTQGRAATAWERPDRLAVATRLRVDHVMASASLPLLFPATQVDGRWHGDGGVRLAAPLSPALHLGASRLLVVSTRRARSHESAGETVTPGYPPPAVVLGTLMNALFLDVVDQDAWRIERFNTLLEELPPERRHGMRPVRFLVLRPSADLGRLASDYEPRLPAGFRFMTRGLGTRETKSSDLLSLLMFQGDYMDRLIEIGRADLNARAAEVDAFLAGDDGPAPGPVASV